MDKKLDAMYELCDTISNEIETANEKISAAGGNISMSDLEALDRLAHIMKSLKSCIAMIEAEDEGYSGTYWDERYNNMSRENRNGRGNSNARGRSRGRNSYANRGRYTRNDARGDFMEELEELMENAPDERTRKKFERLMSEMEQV